MTTPFEIVDMPNNDWAVSWPSFDDTFTESMKFNILKCIFNEIQCEEVGLGVAANKHDESTIMWINCNIWFTDMTDEYNQYLYKYYHIRGAVFHKQADAEKFKDILEKRYMWQLLKE
jgi:hypothetical protein